MTHRFDWSKDTLMWRSCRWVCMRWVLSVLLVAVTLTVVPGCVRGNAWLRKEGVERYNGKELTIADEHFSQAVEQDPTDWKSLYYLGRVRLEQRRAYDAQLLLEKAMELRHHGPETADILDALAQALSDRGRLGQLHTFLASAVQDYGTSRDYTRQGRYLQKLGDVDGAKLAYRKAAYFAPNDDASPFIALADFYDSIGDTGNAVIALRHAYAVTPTDPELQDRLRRHGIVPGPTSGIAPEKAKK